MRVFDDARELGGSVFGPFVAAGGAFPMVRVAKDIFNGASRAGRVAHMGFEAGPCA